MAYEKRDWKEILFKVKPVESKPVNTDKIQQKLSSRLMYYRRRLNKEIWKYIKIANPIRSKRVNEIGEKHQFKINESCKKESKPPNIK